MHHRDTKSFKSNAELATPIKPVLCTKNGPGYGTTCTSTVQAKTLLF